MGMEDEDIQSTLYFKAIKKFYPTLWTKAAQNQWMVCIPQSCSVKEEVTIDNIRDHVLIPTESSGEFNTLKGKRVHIIGNHITTGSGFNESKAVSIIFTQEVRVPDAFNGYSSAECVLLYLSCPLEGGLDAPSEVDEMKSQHISNYMTMILSYPENETVINGIDAFISQVIIASKNNTLQYATPSLPQQICEQCERAMRYILYSPCFFFSSRRGHKYFAPIMQTLESYVMSNLYNVVYGIILNENIESTKQLSEGIEFMKDKQISDFKIKQQFILSDNEISEAIIKLKRISKCKTPLEKVQCLKDTCDTINECIDDHLRQNGISIESVEMTTDDIIDFLIYTICKAYPETKHLRSDLIYITQYHLTNLDTTPLGYTIANCEVAINWLEDAMTHFNNMREHDDPSVSSSSYLIPSLEAFGGNSQRSVSYSSFDFTSSQLSVSGDDRSSEGALYEKRKYHTVVTGLAPHRKSWSSNMNIKNPVRLCRFGSFPKINPES